MKAWFSAGELSLYSAACVIRGFSYAYTAILKYGVSWPWIALGVQLAGATFVCALPAFLLITWTKSWGRNQPRRLRLLVVLLSLVIGCTAFAALMALYIQELRDPWGVGPPFMRQFVYLFFSSFIIGSLLTAAMMYGLLEAESSDRMQTLGLQSVAGRSAADEAQLAQLRAHIEPHFLFNALANAKQLTESDPVGARQLLGRLADYFEVALSADRMAHATVTDEVAVTKAYLNILSFRMGERLRVEIDVPAALQNAALPPLMLGTLVENAIKHGIAPRARGGLVRVELSCRGDELHASVIDDGLGLQGEAGPGGGIANIKARLRATYGNRAALQLLERPEGGVIATLRVPMVSPA